MALDRLVIWDQTRVAAIYSGRRARFFANLCDP